MKIHQFTLLYLARQNVEELGSEGFQPSQITEFRFIRALRVQKNSVSLRLCVLKNNFLSLRSCSDSGSGFKADLKRTCSGGTTDFHFAYDLDSRCKGKTFSGKHTTKHEKNRDCSQESHLRTYNTLTYRDIFSE